MKKIISSVLLIAIVFGLGIYLFNQNESSSDLTVKVITDENFTEEIEDKVKTQGDRGAYFHRLLRDPKTNQIPENVFAKERDFLDRYDQNSARAKAVNPAFQWKEIGPNDVGGRTRAIAMDSRNKNIMIAGGASGGIWKSLDGGVTWDLKSDANSNLGVTDVLQDPTTPDTWYYSTGEYRQSQDAPGARFYGSGIFTSTDNGETWTQIAATEDDDTSFSSQYDYMVNMSASPTTGSIFFASNAFGIFRTTNGFQSSTYVLGDPNDHIWADVEVNSNGVVIAAVSASFSSEDNPVSLPGVYISTNDGDTFIDVTPTSYSDLPIRGAIGTSESNPNIFYVFTVDGSTGATTLHRFDITDTNNVITSDRTAGIPDYGDPVGFLDSQGSYNLVCKVLPTDSETVFIGGTNLLRSTDGFSTIFPTDNEGITTNFEVNKTWIGGYAFGNNVSQYDGHHPDQHNLIFDPDNPNRAISTHDGGISVTDDITATPVVWQDLDAGYNVTQFYHISMHPGEGDGRIAGGTQDNGTPYFIYDFDGVSGNSEDASSGDGTFTFLGEDIAVVSRQNGSLLKYIYDGNNLVDFSYLSPLGASNVEFVNPYAVNPSDENYMFFVENTRLWKNDALLTIPRNTANPNGTNDGWAATSYTSGTTRHAITALAFSTNNPSNRLYYGSSDPEFFQPRIFRVDDITLNDGEVQTVLTGSEAGANVNAIAVNPDNGDELIAVMSNYEVESVFYSNDGAATWIAVGGNLEVEFGPSVRSAAITPTNSDGKFFFVGTSVGLFYTDQLDGANTVWTRAGEDIIGNAIVSSLDYRRIDQTLAVGTHGRGMFIGKIGNPVSNEFEEIAETPNSFNLQQNYPNPFNPSTNIEFTLASNSRVNLTIFDINGREVASIYNQQVLSAGQYSSNFDASALASGTYIYRIEAFPVSGGSPFQQSRTMTLIK